MIVTLTLPDEYALIYQEEAQERKISLPVVLEGRLIRAGDLDPRGRYLIIAGRTRERLEEKLGGGHLLTAEDLLRKVDRLARIKFGEHEILLSAGQMEEVVYRANRQGKSIDRYLTEIWETMSQQFFSYAP